MIKSHLLYQLSYGVDFLDGTGAKVTLFEKPANDYSKNIAFIMANKKIWLNLPPKL